MLNVHTSVIHCMPNACVSVGMPTILLCDAWSMAHEWMIDWLVWKNLIYLGSTSTADWPADMIVMMHSHTTCTAQPWVQNSIHFVCKHTRREYYVYGIVVVCNFQIVIYIVAVVLSEEKVAYFKKIILCQKISQKVTRVSVFTPWLNRKMTLLPTIADPSTHLCVQEGCYRYIWYI